MGGATLGRRHVLIAAGWLFAWLVLEMAFFGEPMSKPRMRRAKGRRHSPGRGERRLV